MSSCQLVSQCAFPSALGRSSTALSFSVLHENCSFFFFLDFLSFSERFMHYFVHLLSGSLTPSRTFLLSGNLTSYSFSLLSTKWKAQKNMGFRPLLEAVFCIRLLGERLGLYVHSPGFMLRRLSGLRLSRTYACMSVNSYAHLPCYVWKTLFSYSHSPPLSLTVFQPHCPPRCLSLELAGVKTTSLSGLSTSASHYLFLSSCES